MIRVCALLLVVLVTCSLHSQKVTSPAATTFKASLIGFQKQATQIRDELTNIHLESTPVSYAEGKLINDEMALLRKNLDYSELISLQVLHAGNLVDEINYLTALREVLGNLENLTSLLSNAHVDNTTNASRLVHEAQSLQTLSTEPLNRLYIQAHDFVIARAETIDRGHCGELRTLP